MKFITLLTTLVMISCASQAQKNKDIPAFGKIDKSEIDLKECEFDKNAEAVVLFDEGKFTTNFTGGVLFSEMKRHVRIKILSDKGLENADISIPYLSYKGQESVKGLNAQTYNDDGSGNMVVSRVEKNVVYTKKISAHYSQDVFTFPNVKTGSIIEYEYSIRGTWIKDWHFQSSIPVLLSRYIIEFPVELELVSEQFGNYAVTTTQTLKGNNNIHTHTIRNLPGFRDEPYITVDDDYLQKLHSTVIAITVNGIRKNFLPTWPEVIKDLMADEDFGVQLKKNIPRTADLDIALKPLTSD